VSLVAAGVTLMEVLKAYDLLQREGITVRVIDLYSIKPVDERTLLEAAQQTKVLITVEDHYPEGGLGDAVCGAVASEGVRVHKMAVNQVPRSGKPDELLDLCGINARCIVEKVKSLLGQ